MTEGTIFLIVLRTIIGLAIVFLALRLLWNTRHGVIMGIISISKARIQLHNVKTGKIYQIVKRRDGTTARFIPGIKPGNEHIYIKSLKEQQRKGVVRVVIPILIFLFLLVMAYLVFPI